MDETEEPQSTAGSSSGTPQPSASPSASASAGQTYNFDFYMRFTKPLILNLPDPNDKTIAAAWVKKLKNDSASEELRTEYIKLLLFVLHRRKLGGIFVHHPGDENIEELPEGSKVINVARDILQTEHDEKAKRMQNKQRGRGAGDFPPYSIEVSGDMQQYASSQEIPQFGTHLYYALSTEPLHTWDNLDVGVVPKELLADSAKTAGANASNLSLKSNKSRPLMEAEKSAAKSPKSKSPAPPPFSPLARKEACPTGRRPITWGSNLLEVSEPNAKRDADDEDDEEASQSRSPVGLSGQATTPPQGRYPSSPSRTPSRSPKGSSPARRDASRTGSPSFSFRPSPSAQSPRKSPRSGARSPGGGLSMDDLSRMQDDFNDIFGRSYKGSPKSPRSRAGQMADVLDTSMPGDFNESFKSAPSRGSSKSPKSPKPTSPLPQVRHISMSSRDEEARAIIEEANKLLEAHELRVKESSASSAGSPKDRSGDRKSRESPEQSGRTPANRSPMRPSPRADMMHTPRRPSFSPRGGPGISTPETPSRGKRTMLELFPDIEDDEDTDDRFLFGNDSDVELDEVSYMDELYEDLDQQIRQIQEEYALESDSLPIGAGVPATTPGLSNTPIRRREYGVEFPVVVEDEDIPDLFNMSVSPESKSRLEYDRQKAKIDALGLIPLMSERKSPSPKKSILYSGQSPRTPKQRRAAAKDKTPSPKPSPKKPTPSRRTQEDEEDDESMAQYETLYETLIADSPKAKSPKDKKTCTNLPPSMQSPNQFSLGWVTPPHLKVTKEVQKPPSPSFTYHLGPPRPDEFLSGETFPDLNSPESPPRPPERMDYDEYIDPFKYEEEDSVTNLLEEEEPLGAKLEAHEWHPYKPRQFSIKVGARARNVVLPRRSAPPNVETISEEAEYYYLNSPSHSPAQPVEVDYDAPYMLPSQKRKKTKEESPTGRAQTSAGTTQTRSPQQGDKSKSSEALSILEEVTEHFATTMEDPRQQALLQHVTEVVRAVECQAQPPQAAPTPPRPQTPTRAQTPTRNQAPPSPRTPPRMQQEQQQQVDWLAEGSPPPGYGDVDAIDASSPPRTPGRHYATPKTPPKTPNLEMGTPPRFDEVDTIESAPSPRTPMRQQAHKRQQTTPPRQSPQFDFAGPTDEYMPENGPLDYGESMQETPKRNVNVTIDTCQRDAQSQTVRHTERCLNETWPRADAVRERQGRRSLGTNTRAYAEPPPPETKSEVTETDEVTIVQSEGGRPKKTKKHIKKRINFDQIEPADEQPPPASVQDTIFHQVEVQTPPTFDEKPDGSRTVTKQVKKKINFEQMASTASGSGPPQAQQNYAYMQTPPRPPPPDDLMGVEGYVEYTPQQHLMDASFSEQALQTPMKLPITIPGWSTPEHLKIQQSPQMSPANFPWIVPVRYPGALDAETMPDYFEEPYDLKGASARPYHPRPASPVHKAPIHKTQVTKILRTPDGTTTTTTIETLEQTSPIVPDFGDDFMTPVSSRMPAPPPPPQPFVSFGGDSSTPPRGQRITTPRSYSPSQEPPPRQSPQMPTQEYSPGQMWSPPPNAQQVIDFQLPQFFDEQYDGEEMQADEPAPCPSPFADVMYNPPPMTPPMGPYANLASPSQYKTPEYKKTTYIHEERPLYDRVEQIVEDVVYEPEDIPAANVSPARPYTLTSPPRVDYFDVIDVGNRPGIETEDYMNDLYGSPPPRTMQMAAEQQSPYTPRLLQGNDWDLWNTPPSGRAPSPGMQDMPIPMGEYEPLDLDDYADFDQSYMSEPPMSPGNAYEQTGVQFDLDPQDFAMPQDPGMAGGGQPLQNEGLSPHTTTTTTTMVTEEYYDEIDEMPIGMADVTPPRFDLQWESPPREQLPTYEPYVPPSRYRPQSPVTPPAFADDPFESGMGYEEEPFLYGTPETEAYDDQCYDGIESESPQFYQSP